jgi:uncharacterized protein YdeI (YjbR/CyaY-like superfamily)
VSGELTGKRSEPLQELVIADAVAWRRWLDTNHAGSQGVWLVVAKSGATRPTKLTYADALEEGLAYDWIDGQALRRDDASFRVRFTPRRKRSAWSKRNTVIAERLISEGRMHAAGAAEIERARSDGRWPSDYDERAGLEIPRELAAALEADPAAKATFGRLSAPNRYAVLYRIHDATSRETRARRAQQFAAMLAKGETVYARRGVLSR